MNFKDFFFWDQLLKTLKCSDALDRRVHVEMKFKEPKNRGNILIW